MVGVLPLAIVVRSLLLLGDPDPAEEGTALRNGCYIDPLAEILQLALLTKPSKTACLATKMASVPVARPPQAPCLLTLAKELVRDANYPKQGPGAMRAYRLVRIKWNRRK